MEVPLKWKSFLAGFRAGAASRRESDHKGTCNRRGLVSKQASQVPDAYAGIQVNACKSPACENYGFLANAASVALIPPRVAGLP